MKNQSKQIKPKLSAETHRLQESEQRTQHGKRGAHTRCNWSNPDDASHDSTA